MRSTNPMHPPAEIHKIRRVLVQDLCKNTPKRLEKVEVLCWCPDCNATTWQSGQGRNYPEPGLQGPVYKCGFCSTRYRVEVFSELQLTPGDIEAMGVKPC